MCYFLSLAQLKITTEANPGRPAGKPVMTAILWHCTVQHGIIEANGDGAKVKSRGFGGVVAFLQHAPETSLASKMKAFQRNSREIAQVVDGQNVGSMHIKRSD